MTASEIITWISLTPTGEYSVDSYADLVEIIKHFNFNPPSGLTLIPSDTLNIKIRGMKFVYTNNQPGVLTT